MVDAANAVQIAEKVLDDIVPTFAALNPHVEEIQKSTDGESWLITYRANNPQQESKEYGFEKILFPYLEKVVRINLNSGDLLSVQNPSYET